MTIGANLTALGVREARANLRAVIEQVGDGTPVAVMAHSQAVAVILRFDEAERWQRIESNLASLHGLELYPELARDPTELAALLRGEIPPGEEALRRLTRRRREILNSAPFVGLADVRLKFARLLERAANGRPVTIVSYGHPRAVLISYREYRRLIRLGRMARWFASAGLDLASAEVDVPRWLADFRERRDIAAADEAAGA